MTPMQIALLIERANMENLWGNHKARDPQRLEFHIYISENRICVMTQPDDGDEKQAGICLWMEQLSQDWPTKDSAWEEAATVYHHGTQKPPTERVQFLTFESDIKAFETWIFYWEYS